MLPRAVTETFQSPGFLFNLLFPFISSLLRFLKVEFLCPSNSARQKDNPLRPTSSKWWRMGSQKTDFTLVILFLCTKGTLRATSTCYTVSTLHCMPYLHVFYPLQLGGKKTPLKKEPREHILNVTTMLCFPKSNAMCLV